jgi:predicted LPLAT superfamily acyltransferase
VEGAKTKEVKFLGEDASFPIGPFMLAAKFKVPVSFVYGMKEGRYHYHFFGSKLIDYAETDMEATSERILRDFVDSMEKKVKRYPEQWYNYYNFWQQ